MNLKIKIKKIKLEETKNNNAKIQYANKTIENLLTPDNELNNSNTNKTTRKRVVKKVKEVFNNKNEIIKEKSTDKKDTSETKTSKSGWWKRKI